MSDVLLTATKEFSWDMAHMLAEHEGLCRNIHGHTYKMHVTVRHNPPKYVEVSGSSRGMVTDFKELKRIVQESVINYLDHAFVYWDASPDQVELEVARILIINGRKVTAVDYRPTAENMAGNFFQTINNALANKNATYQVVRLSLWETPTSFATVEL